jgi:hypothetical protein
MAKIISRKAGRKSRKTKKEPLKKLGSDPATTGSAGDGKFIPKVWDAA